MWSKHGRSYFRKVKSCFYRRHEETEIKLDMHVCELQTRLENMIWENKELEEQLHRAMKERKVIETVLEEIDEEHEKVLSKIDQLENELQDLREENLRLNEIHDKVPYDYRASIEKIGNTIQEDISPNKKYSDPSWNTNYKSSCLPVQDMILHENPWTKYMQQEHFLPKASIGYYPSSPHNLPRDELSNDDVLERQRVIALYRSLFSLILSLTVGMIIWEAENPCMPLVAALFFVVGKDKLLPYGAYMTIFLHYQKDLQLLDLLATRRQEMRKMLKILKLHN